VNDDCLKLTAYFGERDRARNGYLADAFTEIYARHELQTSLVMRGVEGFGVKHHLRTDRLLTLSEDLPIVSVGVDTRARIEAALADVRELQFDGLVTLERARMLTGQIERVQLPPELGDATKLTVYVGRQERIGGLPAYQAIVALLHERGIAGATVLLGVDGTAHGVRQRARFIGRNAQVPMMVIAVGTGERVAEVLPALGQILSEPLITLERVRLCKRDGHRFGAPPELPDEDRGGYGIWQKLMVYAGEQSRHRGTPLRHQVMRRLREAGAAGATSLRGVWGYHGEHQPHGDSFWQLTRRVPIVTVIVDAPARIRDWFAIVDELTDESGVVTSETVPAFRATGSGLVQGGLALADPDL
jgi:PII-like signaling protein